MEVVSCRRMALIEVLLAEHASVVRETWCRLFRDTV